MSHPAFNQNPEMSAMREDVANRVFRLKIIEGVIKIAAIGLAIAAVATGIGSGIGAAFLPLALAAGAGIASFVTTKARKRLEIDEEFLESRMQGRNWWNGYKMEIGGQPDLSITAPNLPNTPEKSAGRKQ
jgi:hypothetical protein